VVEVWKMRSRSGTMTAGEISVLLARPLVVVAVAERALLLASPCLRLQATESVIRSS
jgi:hypothetical protein